MIFPGKGKTTLRVEIKRQTPLILSGNGILLAGAAKADITPPPGMPMAGYSMWANFGRGFRTRLYTRVLYLKPPSGSAVALVQCDLLTGSLLLNQRVAEMTAAKTDIGIDNLLIAGTHSHSAPGNYFENNFYNDNASNAKGFEPEYFDYLSGQIAETVIKAFQGKKPAKIAAGQTKIWDMTRNRSIQSYWTNKNVYPQKPDIYKAVNPDMYLIRVDVQDHDGKYRPLAAVSSFSIHGTAVPPRNNLYNADVFAYIEREVEYGIKDNYQTAWEPVHAAFNGTHADSSPNYREQGFIEARRIGTEVGQKALALFRSLDDQLKDDVNIRLATKNLDLFEQRCVDEICLSEKPVVGAALAAGADDGPSPVICKLPWLRQGSARWFFTNSDQGHKRTLVGPLQPIFLPRKDFPHQLLLQLIQIGNTVLIPLPFETTKEAGIRIANECRAILVPEKNNESLSFAVMSCANGYYGYVTTPEEYSIQRYEGGHTLYGPQTQPFLARHLSKMAADIGSEKKAGEFPDKWSYTLRAKQFIAGMGTKTAERKTIAGPVFVDPRKNEEPYWSFVWEDFPPHLLSWKQTLVRIEESSDKISWKEHLQNGIPVDDTGYDIAVMCPRKKQRGDSGMYETRWFNPPKAQKDKYYRFAILPQEGRGYLYSAPFN